MKKLLISVFLLLTSLTLQAQEVDGAVKIGGGLDLTTSEVYVTSYFRRGTYKNLVGVQGDLSLERFWKPWVGLGLEYTFLFNGRDSYMPDDKLNGIGRFSVMLGIRIYR